MTVLYILLCGFIGGMIVGWVLLVWATNRWLGGRK